MTYLKNIHYNPEGSDCESLTKDLVFSYGDFHDGVIEIPAITASGDVIEVGYYYGDAKKKNIIGVSTQKGCACKCAFCELGGEKFRGDLSVKEIYGQVVMMLKEAEKQGIDIGSIKHKVSLAKTGEPLLNSNLRPALEKIGVDFGFSFKVSSVLPDSQNVRDEFLEVADFAAQYDESVQIQISIISTSEEFRRKMAGINLIKMDGIRKLAERYYALNSDGRKINLSLILSDDTPCDVNDVEAVLPPDLFRFRFRPAIETQHGRQNSLRRIDPDKMELTKRQFEDYGYSVDDAATPTEIELKFGLVANVTRKRYLDMIGR